MKMLIVDGPALAYRSHYALAKANLRTPDGKTTAATYGYTTTLLKLLRENEPEYACVAFDTEKPTFRHELFKAYKADRPGMPQDLADQLEWIKQITEAVGVRIIEMEGYEADDIIATLARIANEAGYDVVIATGDKDMLQVVNEKTKVVMLSGWGRETKVMNTNAILSKFGFSPGLLPDYFALVGDAIDNVPGVRGIGPKTASALVKKFGSLEGIFENLTKVMSARVRKVLAQNRENAFRSRELVLIDSQVPLNLELEDLKRKPIAKDDLRAIFASLGFRSLIRSVLGDSEPTIDTRIWQENMSVSDLPHPGGKVAVYVNLDGSSGVRGRLLGIGLFSRDGFSLYLPITHREPGNLSRGKVREILSKIFEDCSVVTHDSKVLIECLTRLDLPQPRIVSDTMLAGYLLDPGNTKLAVADLAGQHLGILLENAVRGRAFQTLNQASQACGRRAWAMAEMIDDLESQLEKQGMIDLYRKVELPLARVLADMELRGVKIDRARLEALGHELDKRLDMIERAAYSSVGHRFNLNSPKEIAHVLFVELGLTPRRRTKSGYSTDIGVLAELSQEHHLPGLILEYRQLAKLKSTYVDQLLKFADPVTDKVHANFNQTVTATGRLSSSDPNLQNIPIRSDLGLEIRKAFVPSSPDWILISADYSQIELRVLAHLSKDERLLESFEKGEDIHATTASAIFKVPREKITPLMRTIAKSVNFGVVYGMGVQGLARATGLSTQEAENFLEEHRRTYPRVYEYISECLELARQRGYVQTILGRRRSIVGLESDQPSQRSAAQRIAINTPVQGSAADIIKLAMLEINKEITSRNLRGGIVIQVHDEILIDCPRAEGDIMEEIIRDKMGNAFDLCVPLEVQVGKGGSWYEAH